MRLSLCGFSGSIVLWSNQQPLGRMYQQRWSKARRLGTLSHHRHPFGIGIPQKQPPCSMKIAICYACWQLRSCVHQRLQNLQKFRWQLKMLHMFKLTQPQVSFFLLRCLFTILMWRIEKKKTHWGPSCRLTLIGIGLVTKALKGCKDVVVAASKIRKTTMKLFNQIQGKLTTATNNCRKAMEEIYADFDCQENRFGGGVS